MLFSDYSTADIKFANYSKEVRRLVAEMKKEKPISYIYNLNQPIPCSVAVQNNVRKQTFSDIYKKLIRAIKLIICIIRNM